MNIEDLLFTLEVCKQSLPENANPEHYKRINKIKSIFQSKVFFEK
jgi:hypothetical protein